MPDSRDWRSQVRNRHLAPAMPGWDRANANPNGRPNADVLRPWMNGMNVTRRPADKWIVDFGWNMVREEAALYEAP